jgi:tRNA (guanine37-N1)-methyltransferase
MSQHGGTGLRIDILTVFPEYLAPLELSLIGRAREEGLLDITVHDVRDQAKDRHRTVDDTPYGGGPGMVMMAEPWGTALDAVLASPTSDEAALSDDAVVVIPTPSGRPFTQQLAADLAQIRHLVIACGRYEGIDGRVALDARRHYRVEEVSIGDYVLAGGEVAALVIVEAVTRLVPGVLGNEGSVRDDSFAQGPMENLLEGPVFTKPATWRGLDVPDVLLSGDHGRIAQWRREQAVRRTAVMRPDLITSVPAVQWDDPAASAALSALGWTRSDSSDQARWLPPKNAVEH